MGDIMDFTPEMQVQLLAHAQADTTLASRVTPLVALQFGVLPVLWREGVLVLACYPELSPRTFPALREIVKTEVHGISFDRPILERFLKEAQRDIGSINFPTFGAPDFLTDAARFPELATEKVEPDVEPFSTLSRDSVVAVDVRFRSTAANLDRPESEHYRRRGGIEPAFRVRAGRPVLFRPEALEPESVLVLQRQFEYAGYEHGAGIDHAVLGAPPGMIHPTEIQIHGVSADGSILLHVYDRNERLAPGDTGSFFCEYYYLAEGDRIHRELEVQVRGVWQLEKAACVVDREDWGTGDDLDRFFAIGPHAPHSRREPPP